MRVKSGLSKIFISVVFVCLHSLAAAAPPTYIISGYVQTAAGIGVKGVHVTGNNGATSTVTAADGAYSITVSNRWAGTITVSEGDRPFTPPSRVYANVSDDIGNQNYTAFEPTITGNVIQRDGTPLVGATITANNGGGTDTTDWNGDYAFTVPYNWSGTISGNRSSYHFTDKNYSNVITDQTDQNLIAYRPKISGYVRTVDGAPLLGASISFTNSNEIATSDESGYYESYVPYDWTGPAFVSKSGWDFTISFRNYSNVTVDWENQNYYGRQPTISGSTGVAGVTVTASGVGSVVSMPAFSITVPHHWSGTVSAAKEGYYFSTSPKSYTDVTSDFGSQYFSPYQPTISGNTVVAGATVTASSVGNVTSTPYYTITVPYGWTGTVASELEENPFIDSPKSYTNVVSSKTDQNFTPSYLTISGNTVYAGVTVTASGIGIITSTPEYGFVIPYGWSGTVSVEMADYGFTESPRSYTNVTAVLTGQNFTPFQPKISGYVRKIDGTVLGGATITATSGGGSTVSNASGYYEITVPYNWTGTVSASLSGYGFTAKNHVNVTANKTYQDFTGFQPRIIGYVYSASGPALTGVTVTASNGGGSMTTSTYGYYQITVPYGWSGTVTAGKTGYYFAAKNFDNVTGDQGNQNFSGFQPTLSGYVRQADGTVFAGVTVTASNGGGSDSTNANGLYEITVPYNWSGTVTTSRSGYLFTPKSYTNVIADQENQDFTGFQPKISGTVKKADGTPFAGVPLTASNGGGSVATDASGFYEISVPYNWSGTVSASVTGYYFMTKSYNLLTVDKINQDFFGFQPKISGIVKKADGTGLGNAAVTASNGGGSTLTTGSGDYEIFVPYNWSGTVTATLEGYLFSDQSFVSLTTNQTNQHFVGFQPTISGSTGQVSGVTVNVSGVGNVVSTPAYSVAVPYGWSGMIEADLGQYYFPESPRTYLNVTENQSNQNFTASGPKISGYVRTISGAGVGGVRISADNTGGSTTTDIDGYYEVVVPQNWSGTIAASALKWEISPDRYEYKDIVEDVVGQYFFAEYIGISVAVDGSGDFTNIQAAINAATDGDHIIIHPGIYSGYGFTRISVSGKSLTIRSIEPDNKAIVEKTIISGLGPQIYGIGLAHAAASACVIAGLTFDDFSDQCIYCVDSSPTIRNCVFRNMRGATNGGFVFLLRSSALIENCQFINNYGYAPKNNAAGLTVDNYALPAAHVTIRNCLINSSCHPNTISSPIAAGLSICGGSADITNCTVAYNYHFDNTSASITTCPGIVIRQAAVTIRNSIIWGNLAEDSSQIGVIISDPQNQYGQPNARLTLSYSNVQDGPASVLLFPNYSAFIAYTSTRQLPDPNLIDPNSLVWGPGNSDFDPLFAQEPKDGGDGWTDNSNTQGINEAANNTPADCHLKSQAGRFVWTGLPTTDYNADGVVNMADFLLLSKWWRRTLYNYPQMNYLDVDKNMIINEAELLALADDWLRIGAYGRWVQDDVTSPCIDAGDPADIGWQNELWPHGGRINMGAYGGTPQASMSPNQVGMATDLNHDSFIDLVDWSLFSDDWLKMRPLLDSDFDLDSDVDPNDLSTFMDNWLTAATP